MNNFSIISGHFRNTISGHLLTPCARWSSSFIGMKMIYIKYIHITTYAWTKNERGTPKSSVNNRTWKWITVSAQSDVPVIWLAGYSPQKQYFKICFFSDTFPVSRPFYLKWKTSMDENWLKFLFQKFDQYHVSLYLKWKSSTFRSQAVLHQVHSASCTRCLHYLFFLYLYIDIIF